MRKSMAADFLPDLFQGLAGGHAAGKIRHVGGVIPVAFLDDNGVLHGGYPLHAVN